MPLGLGTPDAGAYEFGAGPTPGPGLRQPTSPGKGKRRLRFLALQLRPRVICKRAHRRCPSSARLRVVLSRPARVSVRVTRRHDAHQRRPVRKMALGMKQRSARANQSSPLAARSLPGEGRGRRPGGGLVKIARTRTLRVR